jgi:hypothetical protein
MGEICSTHEGRWEHFIRKIWKGREHFGDIGVDETTIFKLILKSQAVMLWTEFNWLRIIPMPGFGITVTNIRLPPKSGKFLTS